ncbi:MAG: ABC transporter ATP-binding protein [Acidocella sp.]|nr:ABC transporter ATP-binding protein [Acidocella sp.]
MTAPDRAKPQKSSHLLRAAGLSRAGFGPFDLTLAAGECLMISGRSGTGKSVLLRMLADLDPHEGSLWFSSRSVADMTGPEWRARVMYCAAESSWWHSKVSPHFVLPPLDLIAAIGLDPDILHREVRLCSTGERQRLALIRCLVRDPPVLLLDEPTGPLDTESTILVEAVLRTRLAAGGAIIWVSHDPDQGARMNARQLVMDSGRLRAP